MSTKISVARLYEILNRVTSPEIIELSSEYKNSPHKQNFLAGFEASLDKPQRNPLLLKKLIHYRWIRMEIAYIANQANEIKAKQDERAKPFSADELAPPESVDGVIQDDFLNGVPIEKSIEKLREICLQVIGTEHPTDPLSQEARDGLTELSDELVKDSPDLTKIENDLSILMNVDPIPNVRRDVEEEVNRDKRATGKQFYDSMPIFIESIFNAYRNYYGAEKFHQHEESIWRALEGGVQPNGEVTTPIIRDGSWAGGDADNNENVTPDAMRVAIRINRQRVAERHREALHKIVGQAKLIERQYRESIKKNNEAIIEFLETLPAGVPFPFSVLKGFNEVLLLISSRDYTGLREYYLSHHPQLPDSPAYTSDAQKDFQIELNAIYDKQVELATTLEKLTKFAGSHVESKEGKDAQHVNEKIELPVGELEKFQQLFPDMQGKVNEETHTKFIKTHDLPSFIAHHQKLLADHKDILTEFPQLYQAMRHFGVQLRCAGMSYGCMHVRQDASVFRNVWNVLLEDLKQDKRFKTALVLIKNKSYAELSNADRNQLLLELFHNRELLDEIHFRRKKSQYYSGSSISEDKKRFELSTSELDRIELALVNSDMFENIIISQSKTVESIFEVELLKAVFPHSGKHLAVVPLLEECEDLVNARNIVEAYIKFKIQHCLAKAVDDHKLSSEVVIYLFGLDNDNFKHAIRDYQKYFKDEVIETMFGYSDSQRVSGMAATIDVKKAQHEVIQLTREYGVKYKIFDGPGGDLVRGGLYLTVRKSKATTQGNARNNSFGTLPAAVNFREKQFAQAYRNLTHDSFEFNNVSASALALLNRFQNASTKFYEKFMDSKTGLGVIVGFLYGWGPHWLVSILNSSSRAAMRNSKQNHSDRTASVQTGGEQSDVVLNVSGLRAITACQDNEVLRLNAHVIMGVGYSMRNLGDTAKASAIHVKMLYQLFPEFREIYEKTCYGLAMVDLKVAANAYFMGHPELHAKDAEQRTAWAAECSALYGQFTVADLAKIRKELKEGNYQYRYELLVKLSRIFAFVEDEFYKTREFFFQVNELLAGKQFPLGVSFEDKANVDLLIYNPQLYQQLQAVNEESEPLFELLSRLNNYVANDKKLDTVYGINKNDSYPDSNLSFIARLLGCIGAGVTAFRYVLLDAHQMMTPQQGHKRAINEFSSTSKVNYHNFFEKTLLAFPVNTITSQPPSHVQASIKQAEKENKFDQPDRWYSIWVNPPTPSSLVNEAKEKEFDAERAGCDLRV